jgi:hypothetical protein
LQELNKLLERNPVPKEHFAPWRAELDAQKAKYPMAFPQRDDVIVPQHAIQVGCIIVLWPVLNRYAHTTPVTCKPPESDNSLKPAFVCT